MFYLQLKFTDLADESYVEWCMHFQIVLIFKHLQIWTSYDAPTYLKRFHDLRAGLFIPLAT